MQPTKYQRLANAAVVTAVFSAVAFDHPGWTATFSSSFPQWIFGALGIFCGVTASVIYFVNQWSGPPVSQAKKPIQTVSAVGTVSVEISTPAAPDLVSWGDASLGTNHGGTPLVYVDTWGKIEHYNELIYANIGHGHPIMADEITKIVSKLCADREADSFEFVIAPDGTFIIKRSPHEVPVVPAVATPAIFAHHELADLTN